MLLALLSIVLGIAFKGQNVAYMVGLAFAIAASANFPALVLAVLLAAASPRAARQASMIVGTLSALTPDLRCRRRSRCRCWAAPRAPFPLTNPGLDHDPARRSWSGSRCRC